MIFLGLAISIAYWPLWTNGVLVTRWAALLLVVPFLFLFAKDLKHPPFAMVVTLLWAFASLLWTEYFIDGVIALVALIFLFAVFLLGTSSSVNLKNFFIGIGFGISINAIAVTIQLFDYWLWPQFSPPSGLFSNRSILSEFAAISLIGFIVYRLWYFVPVALFVICASWSRASIIILALTFIFWLWDQKGKLRLLAISMIAACAIASPFVFNLKHSSSLDRAIIIKNTVLGLNVVGYGIGSFGQNYPIISDRPTLKERPMHTHMDFIEILHDLGAMGLFLIVSLFSLALTKFKEKYILIAIIIGASIGLYPLFTPHIGAMVALVAGAIYSYRNNPSIAYSFIRRILPTRNADRSIEAATAFNSNMSLLRKY